MHHLHHPNMAPKAFVLIGLLAIVFLMISSEAAARDLDKNSNSDKSSEATDLEDTKYGRYPDDGYYHGRGGYGGYPGRGGYGGRGGGGYGGPGRGGYGRGYCRFGCCGRRGYGGCRRCCSYPGEVVDAQVGNEPQN